MRNRQRFVISTLAAAVAATSLGLSPTAAHAQMALEEVVVTARKREESLQETPIAVSAFSSEALEELGLRDISDLRKVVPNVDMYDGNGTSGAGNVFIRGVGARNTGVNFDSGVGIYIDGVYASRPDGAVLDNVDVQSVQVLRGPQGTLFGKNTTGGAILYTTNKPVEEFEGHAETRIGNYDQLDGQATINVPLTDTLLSRFSAYATTRDGYVKAESNGNPGMLDDEEFSDTDRKGAQAQLRWLAADDLTVDLNYAYSDTDQAARGQNCEVVEGIPGAGWQAELQDLFIIEPATGKTIKEWCQENNDLGRDKTMADLRPNRYKAETNSLSLTGEWEMQDNVTMKSITAWRGTEGGQSDELDALGIPLLDRTNFGHPDAELRQTDAYSQEFQIAGTAFDDKLDYVVGVYGFTEESDAGAAVSPSGPFFTDAIPIPGLAFYTNRLTELLTENTSASIFSQADWNFNEAWRLTAGLRYTWEERELTRHDRVPDLATIASTGDAQRSVIGDQFYTFPSGPGSFNPNHLFVVPLDPENPNQLDPLADQEMKVDNDDITPMASLQYNFDNLGFVEVGTVYATVSNGFLSGGITDTISVATRKIEEYDPEEVWNYELGVKMDAWDRRLRMNVAMFYTDYEDRQLTTVRIDPNTGRIAGALINAKSSSISGIEIETQLIPVDNLQLTANVTFNEGEIDEYDDERILGLPEDGSPVPAECDEVVVGTGTVMNCPIDRTDENLPRLPEQIYFLAAQYNWQTEFGTVIPMVSWSYRTNVDNCFDRSSCLSGIYEVDQEDLGARLTWLAPDENLRISAYGANLTDERYITGGTPLVDVTETAGTIYNIPRTYGVEVAYDF